MLQPSDHFFGPPLDPLQVHAYLVLRNPGLQVGGRIISLALLDMVLFMQPKIQLAGWAASAYHQLVSSFSCTNILKFSAGQLLIYFLLFSAVRLGMVLIVSENRYC